MVKLTPKLVRKLVPDTASADLRALVATERGLTAVGSLASCSSLVHLDLSRNAISSVEGLRANTSLKWLSLAQNQLQSLEALTGLTNLQVLNAAHNSLSGALRLDGLPALGALILNDNQIKSLQGLQHCLGLNTLVLKSNAITSLGTALAGSVALQKLSAAHNAIVDLGSSLAGCEALVELRLAHNQLKSLPPKLSHNSRLRILDLSGNCIENVAAIQVLQELPWLRNVSLKGCPIANSPGYPASVLALMPHVEVLDGKRLAPRGTKSAKPAPGRLAEEELPDKDAAGPARTNAEPRGAKARAGAAKRAQHAALAMLGPERRHARPGAMARKHLTPVASGLQGEAAGATVSGEVAAAKPGRRKRRAEVLQNTGREAGIAALEEEAPTYGAAKKGLVAGATAAKGRKLRDDPVSRTQFSDQQPLPRHQRGADQKDYARDHVSIVMVPGAQRKPKKTADTQAHSGSGARREEEKLSQQPLLPRHVLKDVTKAEKQRKRGKDSSVLARGAQAVQMVQTHALGDVASIGAGSGCAW